MSNLSNLIVETSCNYSKCLTCDKSYSSLLSVSNLENGAGCKLPYGVVLFSAAIDQLHEDLGIYSEVKFVCLVEVLVNLCQNLFSQHIVFTFHLLNHFIYFRQTFIRLHGDHLRYLALPYAKVSVLSGCGYGLI